ncbi:DUF1672 family protein [Sporosarcina pasteurii]|nr:DUF1672 family protein [Sporosarcina pasteurii]MDS9472564.1 DUF1672 family protein [Sporosarcina pasteurii]
MLNSAEEEKGYELVDGKNGSKRIKLTDEERERLEKKGEEYRKENYVPVQEYIGEGYMLEPDEGTDALAEKHKDEVEQAVKNFFQDKYKTEVKVHNIVGTTGAASIFVESIGEPHFYTSAIIPVDVKNNKVKFEDVWSLEDEVEQGIVTGLLAMIYDKEFEKLDKYFTEFINKHPVTGQKVEALANVGANNFSTPYYRLSVNTHYFEELINAYLENSNRSKEEWKSFGDKLSYKPEDLIIAIELFMDDQNSEPDDEIIDLVSNDIIRMEGLPRAEYAIDLHDNYVDKTSGVGNKKNSLSRGFPEQIIKV